mmetsp:Transcript_7735/g.29009  ORF Transcript_7735/g.29009 Transcript_7735/m.29009 type:complete len:90 (+) Transcript_7735:1839-2108(+)
MVQNTFCTNADSAAIQARGSAGAPHDFATRAMRAKSRISPLQNSRSTSCPSAMDRANVLLEETTHHKERNVLWAVCCVKKQPKISEFCK